MSIKFNEFLSKEHLNEVYQSSKDKKTVIISLVDLKLDQVPFNNYHFISRSGSEEK